MSVTNVKKGEERQYLEDGRMKLVGKGHLSLV